MPKDALSLEKKKIEDKKIENQNMRKREVIR